MELTKEEKYVIQVMRELKPFELVEVHKDKTGKPHTFIVIRSTKTIITDMDELPCK